MGNEHLKAGETSFESKPAIQSKPGKPQQIQHPMLQMQQAIGNQALIRMLRAKAIQAKLTVGAPNDIYEQEADRVADQVMRMPNPALQRQPDEEEEKLQTSPLTGRPLAGTITPLIQRQAPEEEEEKLQTSPFAGRPLAGIITPMIQRQAPEEEEEKPIQAKAAEPSPLVDSSLEANINNLRGAGQPLPESVRNYFEPRFGYDFSQVRVHNDYQAAESAQAVNARAFTLGNDLVFGSGEYAPEHEDGKRLIAHELTHVIQQSGNKSTVQCWNKGDHHELTKQAATPIFGNKDFVKKVINASSNMDYKAGRLGWTGPLFLAGITAGEGPDHGEDGNYSNTDESAAREQNIKKQNEYRDQAIQNYQTLKKKGKKDALTDSDVIDPLGDACHVAQDRGSHCEGVKGRGHDDPRTKGKPAWNPDNPQDNAGGYVNALSNTKELLNNFASKII